MELVNRQYDRVIMLELNEISRNAVDLLVQREKCINFRNINDSWIYKNTISETQYENIEPWIQWVTAHTGKSLNEHKIFRLGDAEKELRFPQTWEMLSTQGISSAIVGSMNVKRGNVQDGFFFPDPWSKSAKVFPIEYQPLFNLLSEKVQTHSTAKITKFDILKAFNLCRKFKIPLGLYCKVGMQLIHQKIDETKRWRLAALFDLLLAHIFQYLLTTTQYGYYTLFLNAVAHYQHHFWRNFDPTDFDPMIRAPDCHVQDDPMTYGYEIYDRILSNIIDSETNRSKTLIIVLSGLSQVPFYEREHVGGMNYYRLNKHTIFTNSIKLRCEKVLPMMSRDWQLSYINQDDLMYDKDLLGKITLGKSEKLFKIGKNTENTLFVETVVTRHVANSEMIYLNEQKIGCFNEFFTKTAIKSGHHTGVGSAWFSGPVDGLPETAEINLTHINSIVLSALGANSSIAASASDSACIV